MKPMMIAAALVSGLAGQAPADTPMTRLMEQETRALKAISGDRMASYIKRPEVGIAYSRDWLARQTVKGGDEQTACLSEALYFEARGESVKGQFAVAEVIMNRVDSADFPDTICGVIHQGTGRKYQCQFTYTCDGNPEHIADKATFADLRKVARLMAQGAPRRLTDGATFYHTRSVNPRWARVFRRTATIGVHHFYRKPTQLSQN
jgi:spore germination cell wall hydrolase CwlJ-like protein